MAAPKGNQNGARAAMWRSALKRALARSTEVGTVSAGLARIADKVVLDAALGDKDAWNEIGKRLDGLPSQPVDAQVDGTITIKWQET